MDYMSKDECEKKRNDAAKELRVSSRWLILLLLSVGGSALGIGLLQIETNSAQTAQIQANKETISIISNNINRNLEGLGSDVREIRQLLIEQTKRNSRQ